MTVPASVCLAQDEQPAGEATEQAYDQETAEGEAAPATEEQLDEEPPSAPAPGGATVEFMTPQPSTASGDAGDPAPVAQETADGVGAPPPAPAEVARDEQGRPLITNSFFDTDVREVLFTVAAQADVTIMTGDTVGGYVTIDMVEMPLDEALDLLVQPLGLVWAEIRPGVFMVGTPDPRSPLFPYIAATEMVSVHYSSPDELVKLLPERMALFVTSDVAGRRVIVEAPERMLPDIVERIEMLDTRPGQVMIEALVIETSAGALREFDAEFATSHFGVSASGGIVRYESVPRLIGDGNNIVRPQEGNIVLGLRWLLSNDRAQLRASPRIIALDGEEAKIEVGTEQYFSILTGSAAYAYTRLEKIDATISLDILPRIIAETGEVHCVIRPNVSDVAGRGEGGLPVITVRRAESTVRLTQGEAVVIGGLIEERTTRRTNRVPILSEIPVVGELFKSTRRSQEQREIVILLAPHILDDSGQVTTPLLSDTLLGDGPLTDDEADDE